MDIRGNHNSQGHDAQMRARNITKGVRKDVSPPWSGIKEINGESGTHTKRLHTRQSRLRGISFLQSKQTHYRRIQVKARTPEADMGKARIVRTTYNMSKRVEEQLICSVKP